MENTSSNAQNATSRIELQPGTRLRNARERLGLTYRDVERASYELACQRGRPDFVVHLSRLADIENKDVTPSLYKLYSLAVIYHLDPREVCHWYEVPFEGHFMDGNELSSPNTHLAAAPAGCRLPVRFDPGFNPQRTEFLTRLVERWGELEGTLFKPAARSPYLYGYIGLEDRMMDPLMRPGSLVLIDPRMRQIEDAGWSNEYERPVYFLELRTGYRCCWCNREGNQISLIPHPLSKRSPEVYEYPNHVDIIGQVVGVSTRLGPR